MNLSHSPSLFCLSLSFCSQPLPSISFPLTATAWWILSQSSSLALVVHPWDVCFSQRPGSELVAHPTNLFLNTINKFGDKCATIRDEVVDANECVLIYLNYNKCRRVLFIWCFVNSYRSTRQSSQIEMGAWMNFSAFSSFVKGRALARFLRRKKDCFVSVVICVLKLKSGSRRHQDLWPWV